MSVDYLLRYMTPEGFDFPNLLNDDFFKPIRLLYNNRHYVSANKLLMNFVDSMGFLEFGDTGENTFTRFLAAYADLTKLGVTADELWEQRNSLLHMSNLDSRKVLSGKVRRLASYVGTLPDDTSDFIADTKYYNLKLLIDTLGAACTRWAESFRSDEGKFELFLDRYDLVVSDNRMLEIDTVPNRPSNDGTV
jgi:hypothetical protein